jgi:site-specific recombinase XerC
MNALTVITEPTTELPTTILSDLDAAHNYARQSLSAATRTAYESDWRVFGGWCADRGVEASPASPASVAAFLAVQADQGLRPATIARRCAAIRHHHRLAGVDPVPTDAAVVKSTMKGLRRSLGTAQAKKAPATATIAKRMVDVMPGDSLKGRRDRAMIMLGFAGAFRKSEVVALNVEDLEFCTRACASRYAGRRPIRKAKDRLSQSCGAPGRSVRCGCCASGSTPPASSRGLYSGRRPMAASASAAGSLDRPTTTS